MATGGSSSASTPSAPTDNRPDAHGPVLETDGDPGIARIAGERGRSRRVAEESETLANGAGSGVEADHLAIAPERHAAAPVLVDLGEHEILRLGRRQDLSLAGRRDGRPAKQRQHDDHQKDHDRHHRDDDEDAAAGDEPGRQPVDQAGRAGWSPGGARSWRRAGGGCCGLRRG